MILKRQFRNICRGPFKMTCSHALSTAYSEFARDIECSTVVRWKRSENIKKGAFSRVPKYLDRTVNDRS